jgi:hypothetical protein
MRKTGASIADHDGSSAAGPYTHSAAAWAPLLCGLHCALVPAVALIAPGLLVPERVEQGFMLVAVAATAVLLRGGLRAHGQWRVLAPIALGLVCWGLAFAAHARGAAPGGVPEWVVGVRGVCCSSRDSSGTCGCGTRRSGGAAARTAARSWIRTLPRRRGRTRIRAVTAAAGAAGRFFLPDPYYAAHASQRP